MLIDKIFGELLDQVFEGWNPWHIALASSLTTVLCMLMFDFLFQDDSLLFRGKKFVLRNVRRIPLVRSRIAKEFKDTKKRMEGDLLKTSGNLLPIKALSSSRSVADVVDLATKYKGMESADWSKLSGTVYSGASELTKLATTIYSQFAWSNPLHPAVFPSVRQMESEVVRMCCTMFNGDSDTCGSMTSGGTESILMACKAYRDYAISRGVKKPVIVAPSTAHAAFDKAAEYLGIRIRRIAVDTSTYQVDLQAMKGAIDSRTCMLVGSAPQFPHGIIDGIEQIAAFGKTYHVPVHVDCCLGGFILPFMEKAGYPINPFDFRLPGVTSISADTHKYGYAPKGSSVIMYRNHTYLHHQYSVAPDWPGGIYASPSLSGSRVGSSIATAWATMLFMGEDGYVQATKEILTSARAIERGLRQLEEIFVLGKPEVTVIAIGSKVFNIYRLSDELTTRGWNLNALQYPSSIHICVTRLHTNEGVVNKFLEDVRQCIEAVMQSPGGKDSGTAAIYGMSHSIPDRSVISEMAWAYLDTCVALPVGE